MSPESTSIAFKCVVNLKTASQAEVLGVFIAIRGCASVCVCSALGVGAGQEWSLWCFQIGGTQKLKTNWPPEPGTEEVSPMWAVAARARGHALLLWQGFQWAWDCLLALVSYREKTKLTHTSAHQYLLPLIESQQASSPPADESPSYIV